MPTIAAAPFPYEFPAQGLALMVIDMQRDFLEPGDLARPSGTTWRRWRPSFLKSACRRPCARRMIGVMRACSSRMRLPALFRPLSRLPWK